MDLVVSLATVRTDLLLLLYVLTLHSEYSAVIHI